MNAIDILIIMQGFILLFALLFVEAHLSILKDNIVNDSFLRRSFIQKPRTFSLYCAIVVAIGVIMMIAPALSFFFENSTLYGVAATIMLLVGSPGGAVRTYQKLLKFSLSVK